MVKSATVIGAIDSTLEWDEAHHRHYKTRYWVEAMDDSSARQSPQLPPHGVAYTYQCYSDSFAFVVDSKAEAAGEHLWIVTVHYSTTQ